MTIWVVRQHDDLYVRGYCGDRSHWHAAVQETGRARIRVDDIEADVDVDEAGPELNEAIDAAYRAKYGDSPYVAAMIEPDVRATTLRLIPRRG